MENKFYIEKIIQNVKKILQDCIAYDLSCEAGKVLELNDTYFETIKRKFRNHNSYNSIRDIDSLTKTEFLIMVLDEEPFVILNEVLPNIKTKQVYKTINSINSIEDYTKYEFNIYDELKFDDFSIITYVDEPSVIYGYEYDFLRNTINFNIKYCDLFDKKVYLEGKFIREENVSVWDIEDLGLKICCDVSGILKEDNIPTFIEYLLESCINIKYKNFKMALFNLFASFDNFIEVLYEKTFNFYIRNYAKYIDKLDCLIKDELDSLELNDYDSIYNEIFSKMDSYLKKKIRYYANLNRRLIDEKLVAVLKELDIHKNSKYTKFNKIIRELKNIEMKRNLIAHGEKFEFNQSIGEVVYKILTVICSIVCGEDFLKNGWNYIIYDTE